VTGPAAKPGAEALPATFTVEDALQLDELRIGSPEVICGHGELSRPIRWAHAGEVRNLPSLLRGGELVLTTGMALQGDPRAMRAFAADLAERGIAGLVLELGTSFPSVPRPLAGSAAEHDLPLIVLHREVAFVEVTEAINHALLNRQLLVGRSLEALQQRFTGLVLDGAGVPEILGILAAEVGNPIVLQREDGDLLFHAIHRADSGLVLSAWDALRRDLPDAPAALAVPLPSGREAPGGTLTALAVDNPLDELTRPALERAGALVALIGRQLRQEEVLVARERGNLLAELMDAELSEAEIARRVGAMGFPRLVPYLLPCVLGGPAGAVQGARETVWTMTWREIRHELEANSIPVLGGLMPGEGRLAMVVGLAKATQREARADALAALAGRAIEGQFGEADAGLLYVGDASRSWTGAVRSLREVAQASSSPRPDAKGWYDATRPDLQRLLWSIRDLQELRSFVTRRLGPLIEHDEARRSELLRTLEVYLECGGRKTDTARALHVERQSLYHRLSRIESLLGESLDDADLRLGTHLALRARKLLVGMDDGGDSTGRG
jgi:PucR family transcriptional regulator, purine catabolism regulatory protein